MKLYHDYKKQFKAVFFVFFLGFLIIIPSVFSFAQTAKELNQKIVAKNTEIEKLEEEIKEYQTELNDLGKQKDSLNVSIKQLDLTKKKLTADMLVTQNKIDKTNLKIIELSLQINNKEETIANNMEALAFDIRKVNEFEQNDIFTIMLSEDDFTTIWNDIDNMSALGDKIIETTAELKLIKNNLEDTRKETTDAKNELITLKSKLTDQKKIVDQNTAEKKKLLAQTKNNETGYQKLLVDRLAKKVAFEKEIDNYESQLKYILDPSKLPGKGILNWPLDYVYITQLFGVTKDSKRLYTSGSHNGVDFRASVGTPVKAMADGVVSGIGNTDTQCNGVSFGRFILIKYNNGLASTYGHLSLIKVKAGQKITQGQIVGYSGNSGYSTGPHLHVSLYPKDAVEIKNMPSKSCPGVNLTLPMAATTAYLDPMYYLPSYK